jgi:hypothetical protein
MKCKGCKAEGSASRCFSFWTTFSRLLLSSTVLSPRCLVSPPILGFISKPVAYTPNDRNDFVTIVKVECRGLEPVGFQPREGWEAKGETSDTKFDEIDLTEGEWADYDEKVCTWSALVLSVLLDVFATMLSSHSLHLDRVDCPWESTPLNTDLSRTRKSKETTFRTLEHRQESLTLALQPMQAINKGTPCPVVEEMTDRKHPVCSGAQWKSCSVRPPFWLCVVFSNSPSVSTTATPEQRVCCR